METFGWNGTFLGPLLEMLFKRPLCLAWSGRGEERDTYGAGCVGMRGGGVGGHEELAFALSIYGIYMCVCVCVECTCTLHVSV